MLIVPTEATNFTIEAAVRAKAAGRQLAAAPASLRSTLLRDLATALGRPAIREFVLNANRIDIENAQREEAAGRLAAPLVKRLLLDEGKLTGLVAGLDQLAGMQDADAVGRVTQRRELDDGLVLERVTCPLGLLGVVFESRPDALVQIASLALRSGNAALLKGGREAIATNRVLAALIQDVLDKRGLPREAALLLEDRSDVETLLGLSGLVDLIIARGSTHFISHIRHATRIPVMGHDAGICHLYLHQSADPANGRGAGRRRQVQLPGGLQRHRDPALGSRRRSRSGRRDQSADHGRSGAPRRRSHPRPPSQPVARDRRRLGHRIRGVDPQHPPGRRHRRGARAHHPPRHPAHRSHRRPGRPPPPPVSSARSMPPASSTTPAPASPTATASGFGGEVGISTDKLHARGPVGVDGLYTYRWLLRGQGQVTTTYGEGGRPFRHRDLDV